MKLIILSILVLCNFQVFAQDDAAKAERIAKVKSKILEHMDKKIAALQTAKSCISSAATREAFKACREPLKALRQEGKKNRQARKERRQNKQ
ncbi:MAG: hypothetical protein HN576_15830 [Bacteriovoracaceae bacterium]|jgi:hypothetical protein|nr:hypothetical protein [Bacteriovoracaceae bacterium]